VGSHIKYKLIDNTLKNENTLDTDSGAMETDSLDSGPTTKRVAPDSPGGSTASKKKALTVEKNMAFMTNLNGIIGWIKQATYDAKAKRNLTVVAAEGIIDRTAKIRSVATDMCLENSRLLGVAQFSAAELKGLLETFKQSHAEKKTTRLTSCTKKIKLHQTKRQ